MESFPQGVNKCSPSRVSSQSLLSSDWTARCIMGLIQETLPSDASDVSATREPMFSVIKNAVVDRPGVASRHMTDGTGHATGQGGHPRASSTLQPLSGAVAASTSPGLQHSMTSPSSHLTDNGSRTLSPAAEQFLRSIPDLWYMLVPPVVESARE